MKPARADPRGDLYLHKEHFGWSLIALGKAIFHYNPGKFLSPSFIPLWNAYQLSLLFKKVGKKKRKSTFPGEILNLETNPCSGTSGSDAFGKREEKPSHSQNELPLSPPAGSSLAP